MKFLQTLLLLLAAVISFTSADEADNRFQCLRDRPNFYQAIQSFCTNGNIVVPSGYASGGKGVNGKRAFIKGRCMSAISTFFDTFS
jgi:hypothetical protein